MNLTKPAPLRTNREVTVFTNVRAEPSVFPKQGQTAASIPSSSQNRGLTTRYILLNRVESDMPHPSSRLSIILDKASQRIDLSENDVEFVNACLSSASQDDQAVACEVVFRSSPSHSLRQHALETLEKLSTAGGEADHVITLLLAMLFVPAQALSERPPIRTFLMTCAHSKRWQIRTNAVSVLERLAHTGDGEALTLIKTMAKDENEYVSANSESSLSRLPKGDKTAFRM
jgi:hypothetical protein